MSTKPINESSAAAIAFLDALTAEGQRQNLSSASMTALFGLFTRRCVKAQVDAGMAEAEAHIFALKLFLKGMGADGQITEVSGEEYEQMSAQLDAGRSEVPLQ